MIIDSNNVTKDTVLAFNLYEKEEIEDELYLIENQNALNQTSYNDFLKIEEIIEDLGKQQ